MTAELLPLARRDRALERLSDIDSERRQVREVEAFELIVAEHHEDVRRHRRKLLLQDREALFDARLLPAVLLQVVHRHVGAQRATRTHLVPALGRKVAGGAVGRSEDARECAHGELRFDRSRFTSRRRSPATRAPQGESTIIQSVWYRRANARSTVGPGPGRATPC